MGLPAVTDRPADLGFDPDRLERIGEFLQTQYLDAGRYVGASVLVSRKGQPAYYWNGGHSNRETGAAMTPDTVVRLYSMTKPIVSVALMQLYERGRFQLDDPVQTYLPAFEHQDVWLDGNATRFRTSPRSANMTIKHLLSHTSGLTYDFVGDHPLCSVYGARGIQSLGKQTMNLADTVDLLGQLPLRFSPGTKWAYSMATDVVGRLVEVLSGQPLDEYVRDHITGPLGMVDAGFVVRPDQVDRFAACYAYTPGNPTLLIDPPSTSAYLSAPTFLSGGGGMVGTIGDYHRFTTMLLNRGELEGVRILGRKTAEYMTLNHLPGGVDLTVMGQRSFSESTFEGIGFGLGFAVAIDPAAVSVVCSPGEFYWGGAASTYFWVDPVEEITVVLITQLMPSSSWPIRRQLRQMVYQSLT